MPQQLQAAKKIAVGTKQTLKALQSGSAVSVYLAQDAESRVIGPVKRMSETHGVPIIEIKSMSDLGRLCRIEVGAAAAAVLKP